MALKLTTKGAFKILQAYFDGGAEPASLSVFLYTAGSPTINTTTTSGITEAAGYTRPVLSTASYDYAMAVSEGYNTMPSNMATTQFTITFSQATAVIVGYLLLAGSDVIAWDTLTPVQSAGNGDTLKLTITSFSLS